ncbi:hypothetical protein F8G81_12475 [Arthrobacter sp. CDRTa11]|uniref:DUF5671 domain-containing protein n=1 Tax=Arthrobacter sp. CDRTa11 TaxID=2651199 RepID=UPI002265A802|nr:DUF5671 domain-containing protein [Arthrobacter sp. CDRTa11]UZX03332.1 hypothetical protein F8G81_12475 [Arthrobacter sp. CDRTa11]
MNPSAAPDVTPSAVPVAGTAQQVLRRLILYVLLFILVLVAATGLAGLLERLFSSGSEMASTDVTGLARALAFTLIGGPLALLLWWLVWKKLDDGDERGTVGWGLYVAAMYTIALIIFTTALLGWAASLVDGSEPRWSSALATGVVWGAVWAWHRWMWRHPARGPRSLEDVPSVVGAVFGLMVGAAGGITALGRLLDDAIRGITLLTTAVEPWWQAVLQASVWAVGGTAVWWWHWKRDPGSRLKTGLADVAVVAVGVFAAGITALGGAGVALFALLRLAFDRTDPDTVMLAPLGPAVAAAAIGALIWRYHRTLAADRAAGTVRASRLVTAGVALAAAASGIGVVVNAALALAVAALAGDGSRSLLLGGVSSLVVGGPIWWLAWKPAKQHEPGAAHPPGRRVYLVAFFGISAVVALVALLVVGYRLFEFFLGDVSGGSVVDRIRGPLGLLVAAGLVAGYHYSLWRHEHSESEAVPQAEAGAEAGAADLTDKTEKRPSIGHVTLVSGSHSEALSRAIATATGAQVTVWRRADGVSHPRAIPQQVGHQPPAPSGPGESDEESALAARVTQALEGTVARHVLLVIGHDTGADAQIEVIPLAVDGQKARHPS